MEAPSVRLYVDFFGSDILVASPLGLVTRLQEAGSAAGDFLSSLEAGAYTRPFLTST
jgi:U3 small nucleolar RNA-associated protein 25